MSEVRGKGAVTIVSYDHPGFAEAVRRWEQVRALDDCPYKNLYDPWLWRAVLEVIDDGTLDVEASVDWLLDQTWVCGRDVRDVFKEWRERAACVE
jgi:hypothetical protein